MSPEAQAAADRRAVSDLLQMVRSKGARLWIDEGQLRYQWPAAALNHSEITRLRAAREDIIRLLECPQEQQLETSPLSFSQRQHWTFYRLDSKPAIRHLAAMKKLDGPLDVPCFERALNALVHAQHSLRTRFRKEAGVPVQEVVPYSFVRVMPQDLSHIPNEQLQQELQRRITELICQPIDPTIGPLFELQVLRLSCDKYIFAAVMDHIISDMWSLNLFLEDLETAYEQAVRGEEMRLTKVLIQMADYARQQQQCQSEWSADHLRYWRERLAGADRLRFPGAPPVDTSLRGWEMAAVELPVDLSHELRTWARNHRTTEVMSALTAYAASVFNWCGVSEMVLRFESHGRLDPKLTGTIGYFSVPMYLRLELKEDDTFQSFLQRVAAEYLQALEHADYSFIEAQMPRPAFTRNTSFNWIPSRARTPGSWSDVSFENPYMAELERDTEPFIVFGREALRALGEEVDPGVPGAITGGVFYARNRFSRESMARFAGGIERTFCVMLGGYEGTIKQMQTDLFGS